jgi:hypothetical protein
LAHQRRVQDARELFDRVCSCGSDLGLFSEEPTEKDPARATSPAAYFT